VLDTGDVETMPVPDVVNEVTNTSPAVGGDCDGLGCSPQAGLFGGATLGNYMFAGGESIVTPANIQSLGFDAPDTGLDTARNVILQFDDGCQANPAQCFGVGANAHDPLANVQDDPFPIGDVSTNANQIAATGSLFDAAVPEPGSLVLLGSGLAIAARMLRRRTL